MQFSTQILFSIAQLNVLWFSDMYSLVCNTYEATIAYHLISLTKILPPIYLHFEFLKSLVHDIDFLI